MAAAHVLVERRLDKRQSLRHLGSVLRLVSHQSLGRRREFGISRQPNQPLSRQCLRVFLQLRHGRIQVLRVPRIHHPHRLTFAKHARQPEDLRRQILLPLRLLGVVKVELLLPRAVVPRRHRHWLPIAALHELQLSLVHCLAHRIVDKALRKRLLRRLHNLRKRHRHRSRDLGMKRRMHRTRLAILQPHLAMHQKRIRSRARSVKRPGKLLKAQRQAVQRRVAIRPRVLQPLRRLSQINRHIRQQVRPAEVELVAQLQHLRLRRVALQSKREPRRRMTGEILSHLAQNHHETSRFRRRFHLSRQHCLRSHAHLLYRPLCFSLSFYLTTDPSPIKRHCLVPQPFAATLTVKPQRIQAYCCVICAQKLESENIAPDFFFRLTHSFYEAKRFGFDLGEWHPTCSYKGQATRSTEPRDCGRYLKSNACFKSGPGAPTGSRFFSSAIVNPHESLALARAPKAILRVNSSPPEKPHDPSPSECGGPCAPPRLHHRPCANPRRHTDPGPLLASRSEVRQSQRPAGPTHPRPHYRRHWSRAPRRPIHPHRKRQNHQHLQRNHRQPEHRGHRSPRPHRHTPPRRYARPPLP